MVTDLRAASSAVDTPVDGPFDAVPHDDRRVAVALPLLLLLVAGVLRFWGLGHPDRIYFDEVYYANDAHEYLTQGVEDEFAVHPPVGKWMIAAGIAVFGFDSFGWRSAAALAGTLTVVALYLVALRLFRHRGVAALAALLLAVDGLAFTTSRVAMLDVFLTLFVVLGFWLLLVDRDRQWSGLEAHRPLAGAELEERPLPRRPQLFRWLAGVAFGLALATKWSGLLAIAAAGLFIAVSDLLWRRGLTGRVTARLGRLAVSGLLTLVVVPLVVYVISYLGWFANADATRNGDTICPGGDCEVVDVVQAWWNEQREIFAFHASLEAEHPYRAPATTWLFMSRPVAYYWEACEDPNNPPEGGCQVEPGNVAEILGIGNPAIWWLGLVAYPVLLVIAIWQRDWRAWAILAFVALQTLPWLTSPRPVFLFYTAPAIPFICLALAAVCDRALNVRALRWLPAVLAIVAVVSFLYFLPIYSGMEISREAWDARIWFPSWI